MKKLFHLSRPTFRPWWSAAAILLAYPAAGALYGLARMVEVLFAMMLHPNPGLLEPFIWVSVPIIAISTTVLVALSTWYNLGFPFVDADTNAQINLYPIIVPVACVLLAFANGALTLESTNSGSNHKRP